MSTNPTNTNGLAAPRPSNASRGTTAPSVMTLNGHLPSVGDAPTKEQYERGIQVIDDEKEFKCVNPARQRVQLVNTKQ
jgi:hypothetical protein